MEIREVPRTPRRGLRPSDEALVGAPADDLRIEAKDLLTGLDALADVRVELKVPVLAAAAESQAFEVVDPEAMNVVPTLLTSLRASAALVRESGVDPAALEESADRVDQMTTIYYQAQEAEAEVEASVKVLSQAQRVLRPQVLQQAQVLLAGNTLSAAQKLELSLELSRIERDQRLLNESRAAIASRTTSEGQKAAAAITAEQRREEAMRTLLKLRRGEAVDPAAIRSTFDALNDRRGDGR